MINRHWGGEMWQFSLCNIRFPCKRLWSEQVWSDIPTRDPLPVLHNLTIIFWPIKPDSQLGSQPASPSGSQPASQLAHQAASQPAINLFWFLRLGLLNGLGSNLLVGQISRVQKKFWSETFLGTNFWESKFLGQTFWLVKFLGSQMFGERLFWDKSLGVQVSTFL